MSALDASNVTLNGGLGVVGPWKRGNVEGTFLAFHAHDQKKIRIMKRKKAKEKTTTNEMNLHGPR